MWPFMIIRPLSWYDWNTIEKDVKSQVICPSIHLWTYFDLTSYNVEYDNVLGKFVFQHYRAKVKVTVAVLRNIL